MIKKETKDRIKLACWDAFVLIVTGVYIGIVVYYVRKFYDEESSFNLWSLFGAIMSSSPISSQLKRAGDILRKGASDQIVDYTKRFDST